jgi:hypothetical protein
LAIGDTTVGLAYPWTWAQACGFISATILERGTTMMMIKPSAQTKRPLKNEWRSPLSKPRSAAGLFLWREAHSCGVVRNVSCDIRH